MAFLFTQSHFNVINPKSLILLTIFLLLSPLPSYSSDPDPLQDFCIADLQSKTSSSINGFPCKPSSNVTSNDFFFDGLTHKGNTSMSAFKNAVTPGNVLTFPALNTLGISMNRVDIAPDGVNPPHSHPRATELGYVIKGRVLVGLITTGNVFYAKNLSAGEMFVVPRGLLHFQMNVGKKNVVILAAFNSQLPGSSSVGASLFGAKPNSVPDDVLTKAFLVEQSVVDEIKSKFGA